MAQVVPPPTWHAHPLPTLVISTWGREVPQRMQVRGSSSAFIFVSLMVDTLAVGYDTGAVTPP